MSKNCLSFLSSSLLSPSIITTNHHYHQSWLSIIIIGHKYKSQTFIITVISITRITNDNINHQQQSLSIIIIEISYQEKVDPVHKNYAADGKKADGRYSGLTWCFWGENSHNRTFVILKSKSGDRDDTVIYHF